MCGWARGPCSRSRLLSALLFCVCYLSQFSILFTMVHGRWCSYATLCFDDHRLLSWNAYVLLRRCSGRSDGEGGSEGGGEGPGSSGKGELHVRWTCVKVVAGAVAAVVAVVVSWSVDFFLL